VAVLVLECDLALVEHVLVLEYDLADPMEDLADLMEDQEDLAEDHIDLIGVIEIGIDGIEIGGTLSLLVVSLDSILGEHLAITIMAMTMVTHIHTYHSMFQAVTWCLLMNWPMENFKYLENLIRKKFLIISSLPVLPPVNLKEKDGMVKYIVMIKVNHATVDVMRVKQKHKIAVTLVRGSKIKQ
jgi:hypothetical protein